MPKKDKKVKNNHGGHQDKAFILAEVNNGQDYGFVKKALGDCRFLVQCQDSKERICHVRGSMRKRQYVNEGDYVIISHREYQDDKADIIHVYPNEHVRMLKREGTLRIALDEKDQRKSDGKNETEDADVPFDFELI